MLRDYIPYKQPNCAKTFIQLTRIKRHSAVHEKECTCDICDASCRTVEELLTHRVTHTSQHVTAMSCCTCDKTVLDCESKQSEQLLVQCAHCSLSTITSTTDMNMGILNVCNHTDCCKTNNNK